MKKMECTFYRPEQVNIGEFQSIIDKLTSDFHTACSKEMDADSLRIYANDLLNCVAPLAKNLKMFFLGLDEPENMPSDARVDYFYMPTYIGTAIVIRAVLVCAKFIREVQEDSYKRMVFRGLLLGCTGRGFKGHGYDGLKGMIDALSIFTEAGVEKFIWYYPTICDEFTKLFKESVSKLTKLLETGTVQNEWGEDYSKEAETVIKRMKRSKLLQLM